MKCPNCKSEMEQGGLSDNGTVWLAEGIRTKLLRFNMVFGNSAKVLAYRCPKCGKIELTSNI